jgi:hypothetical protein
MFDFSTRDEVKIRSLELELELAQRRCRKHVDLNNHLLAMNIRLSDRLHRERAERDTPTPERML